MASFRYKAVEKSGRRALGGMEAVNEADLELRLKRMGLDLIAASEVDRNTSIVAAAATITRQDLINFCFDMEQMDRAGIPIIDGLRDLRDTLDNKRFREVLTTMAEDMDNGRTLSQCMTAHPETFDKVFVNLIRAGEQTGRVADVFKNLADSLKWQDELVSQTKRLLTYPAFVLVVVSAVIIFLLTYLVPQITGLLKTMNVELPLQTKLLIAASDTIKGWWPLLLALPVASIAALVLAIRRSPRAAYLWDYAKLRIPVIGPILQKIILARFANFFALMYESGITVLDALRTSEEIAANRYIADGLARAGQQISAGQNLTDAFRDLGLMPAMVIRMLRVGENTGALDLALRNVNYFYTRDVRESVDKTLKVLEPSLTLGLGLIMAFIMWAVLSPVYDILGKMNF
ncbi:MAG: type II secretion system F family protein [Betaproteobacteria bacterium]|nr:type II secretion system F family protein [Betaproteobacteria bacterium]